MSSLDYFMAETSHVILWLSYGHQILDEDDIQAVTRGFEKRLLTCAS